MEADGSDIIELRQYRGRRSRALATWNSRHGVSGPRIKQSTLSLSDFLAHMPAHKYIFKPTGDFWPAASVNARVPPVTVGIASDGTPRLIAASQWLDQNAPVEQVTWHPGAARVISDRLICDGGYIERPGCKLFNFYRPPIIERRAGNAAPWVEHVHRLFGADATHTIQWLAHRIQNPGEKINHALVLGGAQGIGKDTLLEPVKQAVGPWNFAEVSPQQVLGRFNGWMKSVVLRVSEGRDLGEYDRFAFYDHMKTYTAAPPDVLLVDEKYVPEHYVRNVCGVVITTNHKAGGIYLPPDDRRHYVAWSDLTQDDFSEEYWRYIHQWFQSGGYEVVAGYLADLELSSFHAKAPPPKTSSFWEIVDASRVPEDAELADALDRLHRPAATTLAMIAEAAEPAFAEWLKDRKNARRVPHRLEECGYVPARNVAAKDGLWVLNGRRQVIYVRSDLSSNDRLAAVSSLARDR